MPQKKRYLVTHSDTNQSISPVAEILNISADNIKNGVNLMATDAIPADNHVLEFPNVGITSVHLDESEVQQLRNNSNILAVEEDVEVHILEVPVAETLDGQTATLTNGHDADYQRGFHDGLQQYAESAGARLQDSTISAPAKASQAPLTLQPTPWNITMVKAPGAWARGINGTGIRVAVIDTGISNHPDLIPISGGISFVSGVVSFVDDNGHGSHCAGIIGARNNSIGVIGVAPACKLFAVKVLDRTGSGTSTGVIAGMDWAASQGMHVASMSLGGAAAPVVAYGQAVKRLQDRGTVVVIAAGNSFGTAFPWVNAPGNSIIVGSPNASPIAVGAIDANLTIAPFSSRGGAAAVWNQVTVVAPGVQINSTVLGGAYGLKSGTSMSTPHVAGAAALLKQRFPGISPAAVKVRLQATARDLGPGGYDITYGSGLINCDAATL